MTIILGFICEWRFFKNNSSKKWENLWVAEGEEWDQRCALKYYDIKNKTLMKLFTKKATNNEYYIRTGKFSPIKESELLQTYIYYNDSLISL